MVLSEMWFSGVVSTLKQRLANVNLKTGRIRLDPALKGIYRKRVKTHMVTYLKRRRAGDSFSAAVAEAKRQEHKGLSKKQVRSYEGVCGAIARWHSKKNTVVVHVKRRRHRRR